MTNDSDRPDDEATEGISDDKLPEDLQPGEDNPLAEPLDDDVDPDDLDVLEGKGAEQSEDADQAESAESGEKS